MNFKKFIKIRDRLKNLSSKVYSEIVTYGVIFGIVCFLIDSLFVVVIQAFFQELNFIESSKLLVPQFYPKGLLVNSLLILAFIWLRSLIITSRNYLTEKITYDLVFEVRSKMFNTLFESYQEIKTEKMINVFSENTFRLGGLYSYLFNAVSFFVTSTLLSIVIFTVAPYETILVFLSILICLPIVLKVLKKIKVKSESLYLKLENINKELVQSLKNKDSILAMSLNKGKNLESQEELKKYKINSYEYNYLLAAKRYIPLFFGSSLLILIIVLSYKWQINKVGVLFTFFYLFVKLMQYSSDFISVLPKLYLNTPALEDINNIVNFKTFDERQKINQTIQKIEASNISYKDRLKETSFSLNSGEILLIKGYSGSGKTTLSHLLINLKCPSNGYIKINDIEAKDLDYGNEISYCSSSKFLINESLRENIEYITKINNQEIKKYFDELNISNLFEKIDERKVFNEKNISDGEYSRFDLARAFIRNSSLVVLDEITSSLDLENSIRVKDFILKNKRERIIVIISHDNIFDEVADFEINLNE